MNSAAHYDPAFGELLLWGIDDLLTYHYLIAEGFRYLDIPYEKFWALTKEQQAYTYDEGYFYPGPAVKGVTLAMAPADSQKTIKEFGRPEYEQLIANNPHEPPLEPAQTNLAFRRWDEEIGAAKRK